MRLLVTVTHPKGQPRSRTIPPQHDRPRPQRGAWGWIRDPGVCSRHNRGMMHLDAGSPPLWRTPTTLQFGTHGTVRLEDPSLWQLRFLHELAGGIPDVAVESTACACGADAAEVQPFLDLLAPVLRREKPSLHAHVQIVDDAAAPRADHVAEGLRARGHDALVIYDGARASVPDVAVLVAAHAMPPRRTVPWMNRDLPHLAVCLGSDTVEVGPLVFPGRSACVHCVHAHETDRDPAWPTLWAQRVSDPRPVGPEILAYEAGLHAARLIEEGRVERTISFRAQTGEFVSHQWRAHPACSCGAHRENATVDVPEVPRPMTARARNALG